MKKSPAYPTSSAKPLFCCLLSALLGVLPLSLSSFGQEKDAARPHYRSFLWMDRDFRVSPELLDALERLGISGTNVAGTDSAELQAKRGLPFYIDHLAGKGFLYLKNEVWTPLEEAWQADRHLEPLDRPLSLRSWDALAAARARIDQILDQSLALGPVALALDDEISIGRRNTPIDVGFEELMVEAYRAELKQRYENTAKLGEAWGVEVPETFEEVQPMSTMRIRRQEFLKEASRQNFSPWNEYRDFLDQEMSRVIGELVNHARRRSGRIPVGFTGGGAPHPFSGVDWGRLLELVDFCEPYDDGGSRELVRSFARDKTLIMRTLFRDDRHQRANEHELWDYFLRGDGGVIIWAASEAFESAEKLSPTTWAMRLSPVLRELSGPALAGFARAGSEPAQIAILESQVSNRAHWMLDSRGDGRSWIRRLNSYETEASSQNVAREAWQKLLEDLHLAYRHLDARTLDRRSLADVKVLILPRIIALSDRQARLIREFAKRGTVIADCQLGLFDEHLRARETGALDDLFGIERKNRRVLLREAKVQRSREEGPAGLFCAEPGITTRRGVGSTLRFGDVPAMVIQQHDKDGRSVYLNLLVHDYLRTRSRADDSVLTTELRSVFRISGVRPEVELRIVDERPPPIRVFRRLDDEHEYLALLWNWRQSAQSLNADELAQLKPITFELLLPRATKLDFLVGRDADPNAMKERPRRRSSVTITLDPFRPTILRLDPLSDDVRDR